jgi:predicted O-methyltransferase YrrM
MPEVCQCLSTDPQAVEFIKSKKWDLIYIDGNHEYEVVTKDWQVCSESVEKGGIIILDDSALYTDYEPPRFATAGHPGPSRVANDISKDNFIELFNAGHNRVFQKI